MIIKVLEKRDFPSAFFGELEYSPGVIFTGNPDCRNYDWLVVYDEFLREEKLACPREHTILATSEPVSIKSYSRAYTRQFGHLLTNRPANADHHPNYHLGRGYYKWFVGRDYTECLKTQIPQKTKLISTVCSTKKMRRTNHEDRFRLMECLSREISEFEWYGNGRRHIEAKFQALDEYKYSVVSENHIAKYHWSEKIIDAWLCECLPFYAGDPALSEIFPAESFIPIPIDDSKEAVRIIKSAIESNEFEKRKSAILEAKRLLLTKYNFWSQVLDVVNSSGPTGNRSGETIYPRKILRRRNFGTMLEDGWTHLKKWF